MGRILGTSVKWAEFWEQASNAAGRPWNTVAPRIAKAHEDVGCVGVTEKFFKLPIGPWAKGRPAKELGVYYRQRILDGAEGLSLAIFTRVLGWDKKKVDEFLLGVHADLKNPKFHAYTKFYCTYGRKPPA